MNIVKATLDGLQQLNSLNQTKEKRGITLPQLMGPYAQKRREEKRAALGIAGTTEK